MEYIYSVTYSCYKPRMQILLNGKQSLSASSAVMQYMDEPFYMWADRLVDLLYRELEEDFDLVFTGRQEESAILARQAAAHPHCVHFSARRPAIDEPLQDRMIRLSRFIKQNNIPGLMCARVRAVFLGRRETLNELRADIDQLEIRNQYLQVSFETLELNERASLPDDAVPFYLFDSAEEAEAMAEELRASRYGFALIRGETTEQLGMARRICSYRYARADFFDVVFRCFFLFPLVECFVATANRLMQGLSDPALRMQVQQMLAEKPLVQITAKRRVELDASVPLCITMLPEGARPPELRFETQVPGVVELSQQRVYGRKTGTTRVLVYEKGEAEPLTELSFEVYVRNRIRSITLSEYSLRMGQGDVRQIEMSYEPANADNEYQLRWYSDDDDVAQVENGTVHAVGVGSCRIWCTAEKVAVYCAVEIKPYLQDILLPDAVTQEEVVMLPGEALPFEITCVPEDAYDGKLRITTGNLMIVNVQNGELVANQLGTTTVTVESATGRIKKSFPVTVIKKRKTKKGLFGLFG